MRRIALACGVLFMICSAGEGQTIGWRQNWTGRFPEATPTVEWGRALKDSMVKGLRVQAKKPQGATADVAALPMADGALLHFIALGPFTPNDAAKALDEAFLANEADVRPDEGEKVGDLEWKYLKQDRPNFVLHDVAPVPLLRALGRPKVGQVAYAHTYLCSAKAGKVALMLDHTGGCKLWVNGKVVLENPRVSIGFGWWGPMSTVRLNYGPASRSQRIELDLKQGWNRLLFKVSASDTEWGQGWSFLPRFIDLPPVQYEDKNILWVAPMPDRSNANPIIVGDKIFVVSEQDELLCLDKKTGKTLWHAFNNYYEATPKTDRDADPVLKDIEPLEEQALKEMDLEKRRELLGRIKGLLSKADPGKYGMNLESHPAGHWYSTGFTTPAPCSDSKYVYVWMTHGVAACYDLDGNRQWIMRIDELVKDPKEPFGPYFYPQGCALVGGKFVLWDKDTFALDAKTGEIAWRLPGTSLGLSVMAANLDGTDVVVAQTGIFRASDGKALWKNQDTKYIGSGGGTWVDRLLCLPTACGGLGFHIYDFTNAKGETLEPAKRGGGVTTPDAVRSPGNDYSKKGEWQDMQQFSAPIYSDGLMYILGADPTLYVVDVKAGTLVYRQTLPLEPRIDVRTVANTAPLALAGKNIYAFDNQGNCVVFEPGREYKQVALNHLQGFIDRTHTGDGWQECGPYGAPVFEGGRMYVRMEGHLYCIGK